MDEEEKEHKPTIAEILKANETIIFFTLSFPVTGMIAAIILIIYLNPPNTLLMVGFIFFFLVQYIALLIYIKSRIDAMAKLAEKN